MFKSKNITIHGGNSSVVIVNGDVLAGTDSVTGNGKLVSLQRNVDDFNSIRIEGAVNIIHRRNLTNKLCLTADSNIQELITTDVISGCLVVSTKKGYSTHNKLYIECSSENVKKVSITGSGNVELQDVSNTILEIEIKGSGDVEASGKTESVSVEIKGSGDVDLSDLDVDSGCLIVKGSGDIRANISSSVDARVLGSGDIRVRGNPTVKNLNELGSGSIKIS